MAEFKYEIAEKIAVLSENTKGYTKEINMISYNGAEPKIDIRSWNPPDEDGEKKMGKGITLTKAEAVALRDALSKMDLD